MKIFMNYSSNFIYHIINKDLESKKYTNIRTRFPPEPNGYLHIGHAKAICLNFGIAEYYHGQCNLRLDDTNPEKEHERYVESIKHDIQWLGFKWHGNVHYSSDYIEELYAYAIKLIKKGLAYVDELSIEEIKKFRGTLTSPGKNSPYRSRSIKENLCFFYKMRNGEFPEGGACLRAKIDMNSANIVMRDPVLYRIKYTPHHRIGNNWCIYPTYDFSHCIADAIEGITHSLCTLEFQDNRILYNWILKNIDVNVHPVQYEFSRLDLKYVITSKRKLSILVHRKAVEGWDDPRMPTISGLRRRGYTAKSIREFCHRIGISRQESKIELSLLESCIRTDLNKYAPRIMAVINPIKIIICNMSAGHEELIEMPNHPNNSDMGMRHVVFSKEIFIDNSDFYETLNNNNYYKLTLGKEIRLRHAYIIKAESIEKDNNGNIICIYCSYDPYTLHKNPKDGRKITGVIHWVSAKKNIKAKFRLYDNLFHHPNPIATKNVLEHINPKSILTSQGFVETNVILFNSPGPYQIEREGYFIIDNYNNDLSENSYLIFNRTIALKETKYY